MLIRLDAILQCFMLVEPIFMPSVNFSNLLSAVSDMISHIHSATLEKSFLAHRGRPQLNISEEASSGLLELEFTQVEIAQILGCSTKTVHRRIVEFVLSHFIQYTAMNWMPWWKILYPTFLLLVRKPWLGPQYTGLPHTAL